MKGVKRVTITLGMDELLQLEDLRKNYLEQTNQDFNTSIIIRIAINQLWREKNLPFP